MNLSLKQIVDDHINLSYILTLAERRVKHSETIEQLNDALPFLCACMDYLCDYPQKIHHPLENRLIEFMMTSNGQMSRLFSVIQKEHTKLEDTTEALRQQLRDASDHQDQEALQALKEPLLQCLSKQQQHISDEEHQLLPLIEALMTDYDWQVFNEQLEQQSVFAEVNKQQEYFSVALHKLVSLGRNGGQASEQWQSL